jgi:LytS/YehU family sensor histidine kinase
MEFARLYLNLMTRRFPDALDIKYEVEESCLEATVPSLILQPLVENAVKYGTSDGAGWVRIKAYRSDDWLHLEVINPIGRVEPIESENGGRGLVYLRERLECLYDGADGLLKVEESNGEFAVQLVLPWSRVERESASDLKLGQYNPRTGR